MHTEKDEILKLRIEQELPASLEMHLDIQEGKVSLTGVVDSLEDKESAAQMVGRIPGVTSVDNRLTVSGDKRLTDSKLTEMIQERLLKSGDDDMLNLTVEVSHGVALLRGSIGSLHSRDKAEKLISQVPGVSEIRNQVSIRTQNDTASIMNELS